MPAQHYQIASDLLIIVCAQVLIRNWKEQCLQNHYKFVQQKKIYDV